MIITALGAALIGLGTRRWFPSWVSGTACLVATVVAGWRQDAPWLPALTVAFFALSGMAVQRGLLARHDAYALVWVIAASGLLGIGVLAWSSVLIVIFSILTLRRRSLALVKRQAGELVVAGVALSARLSPTLAPAQERATIVVWPLAITAAVLCHVVGALSLHGVMGGDWWTTSSLVF